MNIGENYLSTLTVIEKHNVTDLLRYELRSIGKSPLLWLSLTLFTALLCWSAMNTATLHNEQHQAMETQLQAEAAWYEELSQRAQNYAQPGHAVPYWQDPTDVAGFAAYMLKTHAAKPHLPLASLSLGQSDLLPYIIPLKLHTPFGIETTYDFEAPRSLMLGSFDTSFVLGFLLPLMLALFVAVVGSYERDHELLRLLAAQGARPRRFVFLRIGALSVFVTPAVLLASVLALTFTGVTPTADISAYLVALLLIAAYCVFWLACGALILSWHKGSTATAAALLGVWVILTMGIPLGATLLSNQLLPPPSRALEVNLLRQVNDTVSEDGDVLFNAWLDTNRASDIAPASPSYSAKQTIIIPEMERRLQAHQDTINAWRTHLQNWSATVNILSPPTAMQAALSRLAGTDGDRHQQFLVAVRRYQQQLRDFFYSRIQQEILRPSTSSCNNCIGKLQFTNYDSIPNFTFPENNAGARTTLALLTALGFVVMGLLLLVGVNIRGSQWRQDDFT